jgi:hypothetical protein
MQTKITHYILFYERKDYTMYNEFQPYQEGEPIYITIKRARGLMPSVWPGILVVVFVVFAVSGLIGHYIITPIISP